MKISEMDEAIEKLIQLQDKLNQAIKQNWEVPRDTFRIITLTITYLQTLKSSLNQIIDLSKYRRKSK